MIKINKANTIITVLTLTLGFLLYNISTKLIKPKAVTAYNNVITQQITNRQIQDWEAQFNKLQLQFQQAAELIVLEGSCDINVTYTDKDADGTGNKLGFLQKKWESWNSKSLNVKAQYNFGYALDINKVQINNIGNGNIHIKIFQSDISLKYTEEIPEQTVVADAKGFLAKNFSSQEISALKGRTQIYVKNTLMNHEDLRAKAIEYAKDDLESITQEFGFENITITIVPDFLVQQNEVQLTNITLK